MNILSAILQGGAILFVIVASIAFNRAEEGARRDRKIIEVDLSDMPPFLPEEEDE